MITTYPQVHRSNRRKFPNLLLSQWGCLESHADFCLPKDLNFTFVGQVYRNRVAEMRFLRRKAGLKVFGLGALRVSCPPFNNKRFRDLMAKWAPATNRALAFPEVHSLWNRAKISYTPLGASTNPSLLQIKGRVFQMGLSGTLMLTQRSPALDPYYEEGKEYIAFDSLEDCVDKARHYLRREDLRSQIAAAYAERTRQEHLWSHRFGKIFQDIGIGRRAEAA
jgi:spore maturation protein CgeB